MHNSDGGWEEKNKYDNINNPENFKGKVNHINYELSELVMPTGAEWLTNNDSFHCRTFVLTYFLSMT